MLADKVEIGLNPAVADPAAPERAQRDGGIPTCEKQALGKKAGHVTPARERRFFKIFWLW